jgi:hypothetical protein
LLGHWLSMSRSNLVSDQWTPITPRSTNDYVVSQLKFRMPRQSGRTC